MQHEDSASGVERLCFPEPLTRGLPLDPAGAQTPDPQHISPIPAISPKPRMSG